tara:strand:+ start:235 stop:546 length:312 start_codon:yes stop_codon:yes gene_type:complete
MSYIWNIQDLQVYSNHNDKQDVIYCANYSLTYTDNTGNAETIFKQINFDISTLDNFVAYDSLSAANVIEWIRNSLGTDGVSALETEVNTALSNMLNTSTKTLR